MSITGGAITYTDSSGLNPRSSPPYEGGYVVHTFLSTGNLVVTASKLVDYLVVAGGGGGGNSVQSAYAGGGGGAGGYRTGTVTLPVGTIPATVGTGGASNTSGLDSVLDTITSIGGGRGVGTNWDASGGSGGGGYYGAAAPNNGTAGQGYSGGGGTSPYTGASGYCSGGGGGAGSVGGNGTTSVGGVGGTGASSAITGVSTTYAGGGGGAAYAGGTGGLGGSSIGGVGRAGGGGVGGNAVANTGSGGGGGGGTASAGGTGSSGIIVIRYAYSAEDGTADIDSTSITPTLYAPETILLAVQRPNVVNISVNTFAPKYCKQLQIPNLVLGVTLAAPTGYVGDIIPFTSFTPTFFIPSENVLQEHIPLITTTVVLHNPRTNPDFGNVPLHELVFEAFTPTHYRKPIFTSTSLRTFVRATTTKRFVRTEV